MQTQVKVSYTWPNADTVPKGVIPPGALVIALSPLADRRAATILLDIFSRGHDVAIVEIAADRILPPPVNQRERLALRLWALHREVTRQYFRGLGLAVSKWDPDTPLQVPFTDLQRFRRTSRR